MYVSTYIRVGYDLTELLVYNHCRVSLVRESISLFVLSIVFIDYQHYRVLRLHSSTTS